MLGTEHVTTAITYNNMGMVHMRIPGGLVAAETLLKKALLTFMRKLPAGHKTMQDCRAELAMCRKKIWALAGPNDACPCGVPDPATG